MGTATRGAFENIVFSNSVIYSDSDSPMMNRVIGGINVETVDGGSVDGVVISNIRMQNVPRAYFRPSRLADKGEGSFLRNVLIEAWIQRDRLSPVPSPAFLAFALLTSRSATAASVTVRARTGRLGSSHHS